MSTYAVKGNIVGTSPRHLIVANMLEGEEQSTRQPYGNEGESLSISQGGQLHNLSTTLSLHRTPSPAALPLLNTNSYHGSQSHNTWKGMGTPLMVTILLYILLSWGAAGITIYLLLNPTGAESAPNFLSYILVVTCFYIVTYPLLFISKNPGSRLFLGITAVMMQGIGALALTATMIPVGSCYDPNFLDRSLLMAFGDALRCQLVETLMSLLWIGIGPEIIADNLVLVIYVRSAWCAEKMRKRKCR